MKVGITGLGFVGGAMLKSFNLKNVNTVAYDKFKESGIGKLEDLLVCKIVFLCLPTLYDNEKKEYNKDSLHEVCEYLNNNFTGIVVLKSTVEPETTNLLSNKYKNLKLIHNPEFLTARTAFEDLHNQSHIVIGKGINCINGEEEIVKDFYEKHYSDAEISICSSTESECMKIMCNSFYSSKIMLFNEYYLLCKKNNTDFNKIKELMLKNNWINNMHTTIPGPDGKLGYGGACFPKDTNALYQYMKKKNTKCNVLEAVIEERNSLRDD
jgi:UDPglucose 6-dehydrogenase